MSSKYQRIEIVNICLVCLFSWLVLQANSSGHVIFALLSGGPYVSGSYLVSLIFFTIVMFLSWSASAQNLQSLKELPGYWPLSLVVCAISILSVYPLLSDFFYESRLLPLDYLIIASILAALFSLYSPRFLASQLWLLNLALGAFQNAPLFLWDVTDMLHYFNALIVLIALLCALNVLGQLGKMFPRIFTDSSLRGEFVVLLGFALTVNYFYAGLLKVRAASSTPWLLDGISYPLSQRLSYFYSAFYHSGSEFLSYILNREQIQLILGNALFSSGSFAVVLGAELLIVLFLFSRQFLLYAIIPLQIFHVLSFPLAGVYFIYWIVINIVFIQILFSNSWSMVSELSIFRKIIFTVGGILIGPIIFMTAGLGWVNDSLDTTVWAWHAVVDSFRESGPDRTADLKLVGDSGQVYLPINPNNFYPYEKSMGMSWRFQRYFEESNWGSKQAQFLAELPCIYSEPIDFYECGHALKELPCGKTHSCVKQDFLVPDYKNWSATKKVARWYLERLAGDRNYRTLPDIRVLQSELDTFLQRFVSGLGNSKLPRYYSHMYYADSHFVELPSILNSESARQGLRFSLIKHVIKYVGPLRYVRASEVYYISPLINPDQQ